jgi:hypothetical protein
MILQQVYRATTWQDVKKELLKFYRVGIGEDLDDYKKVYEFVCRCEPAKNEDQTIIKIDIIKENEEGVIKEYYDVYGQKPFDNDTYALELSLFSEWAGFEIDRDLIKQFSLAEIVVHILWEMTFYGFDEEIIAKQREELLKRYIEIINEYVEQNKFCPLCQKALEKIYEEEEQEIYWHCKSCHFTISDNDLEIISRHLEEMGKI